MPKDRLRKLILPLMLEQLLAVSVGFIDTFMVSKVGEAAVSGVALVDSINLLIIQVMAAFAAGGIVVISQYIGDGDRKLTRSAQSHLEMLVFSFAFLVMITFVLFGNSILKVMFGKIADDVMEAAVIYLKITAVSLLFWGLYSSGAAILRCHEDTKTAMNVSFVMNICNVVLNAFFVFVLKMGVLGVALATLISRGIAGITMKVILSVRQKNDEKHSLSISFGMFKRILSMGIPSGIENSMFHVGKLFLTGVIATLGTTAIAANAISYQIIEFPNIPGNAIGMAIVVIVGQCIGGGDKENAVKYSKYMMKFAYVCDWICKGLLFVSAPHWWLHFLCR